MPSNVRNIEPGEEAVGIPSRKYYGSLGLRPGELLDLIVQEHKAHRAGKHYDIRIGDPTRGLFSWASRKPWPQPGEKRLAIQQPVHAYSYKDFEGVIGQGYGKGVVRKEMERRIVITAASPNMIHFTTADERFPERFVLIRQKGEGKNARWLLLNVTQSDGPEYDKPKIKEVPAKDVDEFIRQMKDGDSLQEKIDGAHGLIKLLNNHIEVISIRKSKSGRSIVHTERIFQGVRPKVEDKAIQDTVMAGEIWGERGGKAIPPQELGGILNAAIEKAIQKQKELGAQLKVSLFDLYRLAGKDVREMPYQERIKLIKEQVLPKLPDRVFDIVEQATDSDSARKLWKQIASGKHKRTQEGVILRPAEGQPAKAKLFSEHDVVIRRVFPGEGKYRERGVGGFEYSYDASGPIVGRVGTGLSDELREDMFKNPQAYIGRWARVTAQGKFPSGALRAPSLLSLHEDKPEVEVQEPEILNPDSKTMKTAHVNVPDRLRWEDLPTAIEQVYHRYKPRVIQEITANPFANSWQVETPLGAIKVANSHWSPFSFVYDALVEPTKPFGGPTPLLLSLVGGAYGAGLGGLGGLIYGSLANTLGGRMVETPTAVRRLAILGGLLGALPALTVGLSRALHGRGLKGFTEKWPEESQSGMAKESQAAVPVYVVNEPHWRDTVFEDRFLTASEKALAASPVYASSLAAGRSNVTPGEIGYTTLKAGLGSLLGYMIGNIAGSVLSLSPDMREKVRNTGMLAAMLRSVF